MFALRNTVQQGGAQAEEQAVAALADALQDKSALFRYADKPAHADAPDTRSASSSASCVTQRRSHR